MLQVIFWTKYDDIFLFLDGFQRNFHMVQKYVNFREGGGGRREEGGGRRGEGGEGERVGDGEVTYVLCFLSG